MAGRDAGERMRVANRKIGSNEGIDRRASRGEYGREKEQQRGSAAGGLG
jgi:hypothetical protein